MQYAGMMQVVTNGDEVVDGGTDNFDRLSDVCHEFPFLHVLMENDQLRHL